MRPSRYRKDAGAFIPRIKCLSTAAPTVLSPLVLFQLLVSSQYSCVVSLPPWVYGGIELTLATKVKTKIIRLVQDVQLRKRDNSGRFIGMEQTLPARGLEENKKAERKLYLCNLVSMYPNKSGGLYRGLESMSDTDCELCCSRAMTFPTRRNSCG